MNKFNIILDKPEIQSNSSKNNSPQRAHKLFVEKVNLDHNNNFISSTTIPASKEQIEFFFSKPCNHDISKDKLIYDIKGYPYDIRYCAICNKSIAFI